MFVVTITKRYTGMRIEGFDVTHHFFNEKGTALNFAYDKACEYEKEKVQLNKDGIYVGECTGGYEMWPDYDISVSPFDMKDGTSLSIGDSCNNVRQSSDTTCDNCMEILDLEYDNPCANCKKQNYCEDCCEFCNGCDKYMCSECFMGGGDGDGAFYCFACHKEHCS